LVNNSEAYFSINGNTLKLAKTVDYETTKNLSITVKVTDANSHSKVSRTVVYQSIGKGISHISISGRECD
jgi:flavodoxin